MRSFINQYLDKQSVPLDVPGTLRAIGEYVGKQELYAKQAPQVLATLKQVAIIQSTESSNRIEGVVVDGKRLKALVEKKQHPKTAPKERWSVIGMFWLRSIRHLIVSKFPQR